MAKIKWSAIGITNASGKSGGSVFSHNRGGSYVRRWAKPVNAQTAAQTAMRSIFGNVAKFWGSLKTEEAEVWQEEAQNVSKTDVFGDERKLNGFEYFMQVNQNRIHGMGLPMLRLPIARQVLPSVRYLNNTVTEDGTIDFDLADGTPNAQMTVSLGFAVVAKGQNRNYGSVKNKFGNRMRIPVTLNANGGQQVKVEFEEIVNHIGEVPVGSTIFTQIHMHDESGQKGNEVTNKVEVVAVGP